MQQTYSLLERYAILEEIELDMFGHPALLMLPGCLGMFLKNEA